MELTLNPIKRNTPNASRPSTSRGETRLLCIIDKKINGGRIFRKCVGFCVSRDLMWTPNPEPNCESSAPQPQLQPQPFPPQSTGMPYLERGVWCMRAQIKTIFDFFFFRFRPLLFANSSLLLYIISEGIYARWCLATRDIQLQRFFFFFFLSWFTIDFNVSLGFSKSESSFRSDTKYCSPSPPSATDDVGRQQRHPVPFITAVTV